MKLLALSRYSLNIDKADFTAEGLLFSEVGISYHVFKLCELIFKIQ